MKIKKLIKNIPGIQLKGPKEIEITGVSENSTLVSPGCLFISKKGTHPNGAQYITEAISSGAVAIATDLYHPILKEITQIIHPNIEQITSLLAARYYEFPSQKLYVVGITGTNGKTTTSFLVKHMLDTLGFPCGLIGTIEYIIGAHRYRANRTTPDVCSNQKMLREMVLQGCSSAIMEVSSHALEQGRVDNITFDIALFTNLTPEHLDYHITMDKYAAAKQKLFSSMEKSPKKMHLFPKMAVVNQDSPWHMQMLAACPVAHFSYGIDLKADLQATDIHLHATGTRFQIIYEDKKFPCYCPLIGKHNIYNYMAALSVGLLRQEPIEKLIAIMEQAQQIPGRLQPVPNELGISIYIDFAHKIDALQNVLQTLQQLKTKRIITLFGCGGDRDRGKRPKMAEVSEQMSDFTFVTSDNPRSEDPLEICAQIASGFSSQARYAIEPDRQKAIQQAIGYATAGDIVLIAGKGHENYQIFKHQTIAFDDYTVAASICKAKSDVEI